MGDVLAPLAHEQTMERYLVGAQFYRVADVRQGNGLLRLGVFRGGDVAQVEFLEQETLDVQRPREELARTPFEFETADIETGVALRVMDAAQLQRPQQPAVQPFY